MSLTTKSNKKLSINKFTSLFSDTENYVFLFNYKFFTAADLFLLKKSLYGLNDTYSYVTKNTINKIALQNTSYNFLTPLIKNQVFSIITKNPIEVSKVIVNFLNLSLPAKDGKLNFISFANKIKSFPLEKIVDLSKLKDINSLRSSFLYLLNFPYGKFLHLLNNHQSTNLTKKNNQFS